MGSLSPELLSYRVARVQSAVDWHCLILFLSPEAFQIACYQPHTSRYFWKAGCVDSVCTPSAENTIWTTWHPSQPFCKASESLSLIYFDPKALTLGFHGSDSEKQVHRWWESHCPCTQNNTTYTITISSSNLITSACQDFCLHMPKSVQRFMWKQI